MSMGLACYLAMTAAEFQNAQELPRHIAWMACHFSGHNTGLSNLPASLPADSVLILNDRIPIAGHDPHLIGQQLGSVAESFALKGILLDFERSGEPALADLSAYLVREVSCPVIVSWLYAKELDCPVFLPPPALHTPLQQHLQPWRGRKIWLELAMQGQAATVTTDGCTLEDIPLPVLPEESFYDRECCSRYHWHLEEDAAVFTMARQYPELIQLEEDARSMGVTQTVGLYQQLGYTETEQT
ncbi:MAG: hypothetical protein J6A74_02360 [Oscillospiraceae bacterium]|nr:hypothetical protein [Oscillospiraceae bacterium]